MLKTADHILEEAPVSRLYGQKMAFVCSKDSCPWWCHDWVTPKTGAKGMLLCESCGGGLKPIPLEVLIKSTRENTTQDNFEAFIRANAANTGVREEKL